MRPSAIPWPPLLFAAALAAGVLLGRFTPLPWPGLDDLAARIIGYGLGATGVALMAWGFLTLYRANTTVLPHRRVERLVTHGAFRFRRNPIYMGEVLLFLGLAQATGNIWLAIVAPLFAAAVLGLAILPEERHLEARFGDAYLAYKGRTRRWF
jgi:protein-S-isoprenylcysteine O-methyltransferase Ste14